MSVEVVAVRQAILFVMLACFGALTLWALQQPAEKQWSPGYALYELYSWQHSRGGWNFSLLGNTSREKAVKEVFDKKGVLEGVRKLEEKLSEMPAGSKILWRDELLFNGQKQKGSERLKYPPEDIVQEVKRYSSTHNIEVMGPFRPDKP